MADPSIHETFTAALDALVAEIRLDRSILAVVLCGSLSHDTVWAKSDIDLVLVTVDDKAIPSGSAALYANGVNVHAMLVPRATFRKMAEGATQQSFVHTYLAKGRLVYSHDPTIADLCERLREIGTRDTSLQLLRAGTNALPAIDKAHKWFHTRGDLDYTALWILQAATALARIEVLNARQLADREVLPQALKLNPSLFSVIYVDLLNTTKTRANVEAALHAVDDYIATRATTLFAPVIDYLREAGEIRSATEIETHFSRHFDVQGVTTACEYLADQGLIHKASAPIQLTKRSTVSVQELAFYHA